MARVPTPRRGRHGYQIRWTNPRTNRQAMSVRWGEQVATVVRLRVDAGMLDVEWRPPLAVAPSGRWYPASTAQPAPASVAR